MVDGQKDLKMERQLLIAFLLNSLLDWVRAAGWGCQVKVMLSAFGSQVSCRRRCESIVDTVTPCVLQKQVVIGLPPSAPRNVHDISTGERKKNQLEKDANTTTGQTAKQRNRSSPAECSRPRKHKFPLLPHRRGEPLKLLPPAELGFQVTAEDLDREKRAALQRIQDALRGDTEATCSCGPSLPSSALALSAAVAAPLPASDNQVTSMGSSPSSQPLLLGSHPGCSGSNFASTQALSMLSRGSMALVTVPPGLPVQPGGSGNPGSTAQAPLGAVGGQWPGASTLHGSAPHGQPAAQAPDPLQALSTSLAQLSLGSGTQASTLHSSPQHGQPSAQAPDPLQALSTALAQLSLGSGTQASTLHSSPQHGQPAAQAPDPLRALSTALAQLSLGSGTQASTLHSSPQHGQAASQAPDPLQGLSTSLAQLSLGSGTQASTLHSSPQHGQAASQAPDPLQGLSTSLAQLSLGSGTQASTLHSSPQHGQPASQAADPLQGLSTSLAQLSLGSGTQASTLHSSPWHGQPAAQAPDPLQALSTALAQLSLGSGTQASTLHSSPQHGQPAAQVPDPLRVLSTALAQLSLGSGTQASTLHSSPRHGQLAAQAPDPLQALSTALAQLSLGSGTQAGYVVPLPTSASRGTGASAQPGSATSSAVLAPGAAAAPGLTAAPQVPGAVSHAGPNSQQPRPPGGSTMPAPISMGLSAAPPGLGRGDDVADLCSSFGALSISAGTSRAPSGLQGSSASLGPSTGGRPCQSTLSGTAGASTTNHPVSGAPSAPPSSHIPRHLTKRRSSSDGCSTASKAACGGGGILASPPRGPAYLVSKALSSLATNTPSSPALHLIRRKRAAPCNKPSSSTSQHPSLGPKRQRLG
ncbi:putative nuclear envelope pore membrane protein POM 121B [Lutra lutra]|uniref:putative nuclear envelope pore membrane protein POM 121B n=1 Tax=Lutra lutra TaxID=9657 RepID=UPI001FD40123|nr:putative nuclear envelope pore membrane protein POM 121B [Lutra lutra]